MKGPPLGVFTVRWAILHEGCTLHIMSRPLQVYLEDAERKRLEAWVRRRGWTMSQAVRVALRALTQSAESDSLLAASGMVEGLPPDLSEQVDRYLNQTFVAEPRTRYRSRRSGSAVRR